MTPTYAKTGSQSILKFFQKGVHTARTGPVVTGAVASESWELAGDDSNGLHLNSEPTPAQSIFPRGHESRPPLQVEEQP